MPDDLKTDHDCVEAIRRERAALIEQIRLSQETIARFARSQELIMRLDEKPKDAAGF
jgi:hypothetical protein